MRRFALLFVFCAASLDAAAARRALLIGINDYTASHFARPRLPPPADRDWPDLNGAVTDADALRQMLVLLYGFEERDVVTLTDQRATREAILRALDQQLVRPAAKGDTLLFYYAGHGSQVRNSQSDEADRMDESIVPADSRAGARDIRDKELRPLFDAILQHGARLTIIFDNCHSGSGARGLPTGARPRGIRADLRDVADRSRAPRPEDRGALVLSATQDFDNAWETRDAAGTFHGTFSWAMLRAIRDATAGESASDTFLRAQARMRGETPFQQPVMAGNPEARLSALFGARADRRDDRTVVFVEKVQSDGTVIVQGGWAHGLAPGCELRVVSDRDIAARLRVTSILGLGRSEARIDPGRTLPLAVKPGAMLEVAGWAASPAASLRVWTPRVSGKIAAIASLARRLYVEATRRGVRWVTDPTDVTPTHVLRRGDSDWELLANGRVERLGGDPGAAIAAVIKLPAGSSLFVQFPAPAAMIDGIAIGPGSDREGIDPVNRADDADYILLARYANHRLEYAWLRPAVSASDRRKSPLPLRSDWIAEDERDRTLRDSVAKLREGVLRLRRIQGWNLLESPAGERSAYRLALRRATTGELAKDVLIGDEQYEVVLYSPGALPARVRQRYVYVFVIDSFGKTTLLFPQGGSVENRLPIALPAPRMIRLGDDASFEVAPPYGVDTYLLLTTDEPLPDPWILQSDAVRTRAPASPTPLEQLLILAGAPARTGFVVTPASWSIDRAVFESVAPRHKATR
jgi:hypothetical protein